MWKHQQARDIHTMLIRCWASVTDAGPALNQHWVNVSCLLGNSFFHSRLYTLRSEENLQKLENEPWFID